MNKKRVDDWILKAKAAIVKSEIAQDGEALNGYRSQISSLGAAMIMGSFKSAIAFFVEKAESRSDKEKSRPDKEVDRSKLLTAIYYVAVCDDVDKADKVEPKYVFEYVCENDSKALKEDFIDAAIAVKLALNFFDLK